MSRKRRKRVESAYIPSDSESIDGLGESENEGDIVGRRPSTDQHLTSETACCSDEQTSDEEDTGSSQEDEVWKSNSRPRSDLPFTKSFGPNIPTDIADSPLQIFLHLFSDNLLDLIVDQTNLFIVQKQSKQNPITKDELKIFLGINILMGVKKLPSYRDYWSNNPQLHDHHISPLMTVNRFGFILSHLHINDNTKEPKRGEAGFDKLYKLRPLLNELSETFKNSWNPGKFQLIDESMVKFKGRSSLRQYMPAKPVKRGYKIWTRADESGFVCEFQIYTGKCETNEKGLGSRVVKDLTRELVGGNHHVYFDNFFTGCDLMLSLKDDKIFACGTVRQNRTGLPKSEKLDKNMTTGEYEFKTSDAGLTWIKWKDKKSVHFLSNYHDPSEVTQVNRRQKDGSLMPVNSPVLCSDYNKHMGYVDYADRLLSSYKIDRKSRRWWLRLFWHFIDLSVINSFILYLNQSKKQTMTLKEFRLSLAEGLVAHKIPTKKGRKTKSNDSVQQAAGKPQVSIEKRQCQAAHMPAFGHGSRRCAQCSTKSDQRRTGWICITCDVPLCILPNRNCFRTWHES